MKRKPNGTAGIGGGAHIFVDVASIIEATFDGNNFMFPYPTAGLSYGAVSGGFGKGRLPEGTYKASELKRRTEKSMKDTKGLGWSVNLDPNFKTDKEYLRIHPDGNKPGTEGCIGIKGDTKYLYNNLKDYFKIQNTFTVRIKYGKNIHVKSFSKGKYKVYV